MKIDTEGTYTLRYTAEDECGNVTTEDREVVVGGVPHIYGVSWDGSQSTLWTRTDESENFANPQPAIANGNGASPFDALLPWSGVEIVEDEDAGTLVKIPKYWYKWTRNGSSMQLQIASGAQDGFLVSPAHADRGDGYGERDVVYVGRYHSVSNGKSVSGELPWTRLQMDDARNKCASCGDGCYAYDFAMYWTIAMLYLVEYANWDSQGTIGMGCGNGSSAEANGATDAMLYHTGTNATSRSEYGQVQYRHIEGLWSNVYDLCDGIIFNARTVLCNNAPRTYRQSEDYTQVGSRASTRNGFISAYINPTALGFEYALYPQAAQGSAVTYVCDKAIYNSSGTNLCVGGYYARSQDSGLFCVNGTLTLFTADSDAIGFRIQKLSQ